MTSCAHGTTCVKVYKKKSHYILNNYYIGLLQDNPDHVFVLSYSLFKEDGPGNALQVSLCIHKNINDVFLIQNNID